MPTPNLQRRRALELLEASIDGCTEAIMLAYGFKTELVVQLVNAGLATATIEHMAVGGRQVKVIRMRITAAGRRALSKLRWPWSLNARFREEGPGLVNNAPANRKRAATGGYGKPQTSMLLASPQLLAKLVALDLAGRRARQIVGNFEPPRPLVGRQ